jgi:hypothetical protein
MVGRRVKISTVVFAIKCSTPSGSIPHFFSVPLSSGRYCVTDARYPLAATLRPRSRYHSALVRGPGAQAIHIAVKHAEGCRNEHGVMNLLVRRAVAASRCNITIAYLLAAPLHLSRNRQQGLQLL